jgi:hypothetical protein
MSLQVDYVSFAATTGANVDTQANYLGSGYQEDGFTSGLLPSKQLNKPIRQATMGAAVIANFVSNMLNIAMIDDGNEAAFITNFTNAIYAAALAAQNRIQVVAFSATPTFDASLGNTFQILLTGNVTGSSIVNQVPGQRLIFMVQQDGTGGRTFVPPGAVPMATIGGTAGQIYTQAFVINSAGRILVDTPMTAQ